jgi:hypothetical protein
MRNSIVNDNKMPLNIFQFIMNKFGVEYEIKESLKL